MATIVYHRGCPDGFTAAWLIQDWLVNVQDEPAPRLIDAMWGDSPPSIDFDEDIYIVDFCYEPGQLADLCFGHEGKLVILDHHETSREWLHTAFGVERVHRSIDDLPDIAPPGDLIVCDFEHSGAGLASWYTGAFYPVVAFVEDRDLWRFKYKGTAEAFATITSRPYTIEAWDELAGLDDNELIGEGRAISRYREQLIEQTVATAHQMTVLGHEGIWVAASPYAIGSDVAGRLAAERDPERFAAYYVDYGDRRRWGLRSTDAGMNVAELAATVGGGGHAHASGFEVPS